MKLNSIENFIAGKPYMSMTSNTDISDVELVTKRKDKPDFDVNREIANRTFIRPLPPKGHIIRNSILSAPLNFVQGLKTDFVALKSASSGEANDHQLGKLNDLGMKLGGLAIATYLFSLKHSPITKAMEFVGLGSFFASMALWPKIALDIPARAIYGFSPFMRYQDSQGRNKGFFSDNQFIPFDMLSEKEINKIGNRLNIPTDIPNRREAVEERMRQIALQNNTMWMLTAGFATPIMSSLICEWLKPFVEEANSFYTNKKLDNILNDFSETAKKFKSDKIITNTNEILNANKNKPITTDLIDNLADSLTQKLGRSVRLGIKKDLENILLKDTYRITEDQTATLYKHISEIIRDITKEKISQTDLAAIIPTEKQLQSLFTENEYYAIPQSKIGINRVISQISEQVAKNINNVINNGSEIKPYMSKRIIGAILTAGPNNQTMEDILTSNPVKILNNEAENTIKNLANIITDFCAENEALNLYSYKKLAIAPDTAKAKYWNDFAKVLVKALGISLEEIADTRYDRKLVSELFDKKMWQKATSSEDEYKKFISFLASEISKIEKSVKPDEINGRYMKQVEDTFNETAKKLRSTGFNNTAKRLVGENSVLAGTLLGATKSFVKNNLTNVQSTFSAILNKANVYRTIYKDPGLKFLGKEDIPKEIKEEIVALVEYLTSEGRFSDYSVKLDFLRNPNPNKADVGDLTFKDGKIAYKYYNLEQLQKDGVFIKSDIPFYKKVLQTLFNTQINPDTKDALVEHSYANRMLNTYREKMYNSIGNIKNFMYPDHVSVEKWGSNGRIYSSDTPKFSSNLVGAPLDELLSNTMKQIYNNKKWLKTFGSFGAGLLGFTVLSQLFFGRATQEKPKKGKV